MITKKYRAVYPPLVQRLLEEESHRKGPDSIKAVKTKLHQLYGAYVQDNAHKKAVALIDSLDDKEANIQAVSEALQALHASTKERLPFYSEFYEFIFQHGPVESVLDIGCGYNPFSIPFIPAKLQAYYAYDIDTKVADLLNRFFVCINMPPLAKCADLATEIPPEPADIALMCKLLPVLEAQAPGSGYRLARELNVKKLLITYPLKSLGGREKGMTRHYTATFEKALMDGELGKFFLADQRQTGQEMLYLLSNSFL